MKSIHTILGVSLLLSPTLLSAKTHSPQPDEMGGGTGSFTVQVTNPSDMDRKDVPIVVNVHRALGENAIFLLSATIVAESNKEEAIPSQLDDLNGDLFPDELAFVADIPAHATATFRVLCSASEPQPTYPPRVCAFMKVWDRKYRYPYINSIEYQGRNTPLSMYDAIYGHGAQWESELVGFRVYMDHRQSIDIYGKPRPALTLDRTNFYSTREDMAAGLGCDILFAGQSVGAASFRGYIDGEPTYIDSVEARGQRVVASGPVRTIVEVTDKNWLYGEQRLQMRQLYTMYAGHRDVQVDIQLAGRNIDSQQFCTGVQKIEMQNEGFLEADGLAGSWGLNVPDKAAEDLVEGVGLGVYVPAPYLGGTKEDSLNYLTLLCPSGGFIRYHLAICALMEEGGFKTSQQWFDWLHQWRDNLISPCTVTVVQ